MLEERRDPGGGFATEVRYIYGAHLDELVALDYLSDRHHVFQDALGSVEAITTDTGTLQERYTYDAFGLPSVADGSGMPITASLGPASSIGNSLWYAGARWDGISSQYHMRARQHEAETGQFVSRDPLEYMDGPNAYAYAFGSPTNWIDPFGLEAQKTWRQLRNERIAQYAPRVPYGTSSGSNTLKSAFYTFATELPGKTWTLVSDGAISLIRAPGEYVAEEFLIFADLYNEARGLDAAPMSRVLQRQRELEAYIARRRLAGVGRGGALLEVAQDEWDSALGAVTAPFKGIAEGFRLGDGEVIGSHASTVAAPIVVAAATGLVGRALGPRVCLGRAARGTTDFLTDVTVKSRGKVIGRGTVDLRGTLDDIGSGRVGPRDVFQNREGLLPKKPTGYYEEFVHPTPGINGVGPQRIIRGQGGELFYTPDHYQSFVPLN